MKRFCTVLGVVLSVGLLVEMSAGLRASAATSGAATRSPITVFGMAPENTATGTSQPGIQQALRAITAYYNKRGGINGHRIVLDFCNDQEDPNVLTQCAQSAVADKAVVVASPYANLPNYLPILQSAGIPVLDTTALVEAAFTAPNNYILSAGALGLSMGLGDVSKEAGFSKVGVVASQIPATKPVTDGFLSGAKSAGTDVSNQISVAATLTDMSPIQAQVGSANGAFLLLPPPQVLAYMEAAKQSGSKVPLLTTSGLLQTSQIAQTGGASSPAEGALISDFFPDGSSPVWNQFRTAIAQYSGPKDAIDINNSSVEGTWVSMQVFTNVAKTLKGAITAQTFTGALKRSNAVPTGGTTPPLNFTKPFPSKAFSRIFNPTVYFQTIKNGRFIADTKLAPINVTKNLLTFTG